MTLSTYDNDDVTVKGDDGTTEGKKVGITNTDSLKVGVTVSALPTGASTAALQTTGNASLASIDTKLTNPLPVSAASLPLPSGASTAALQTSGNASLTSIDAKLTNPLPVSAAALPLPSGASTSALQTAGNASLSSIDTKLTNPLPVSVASLPLPSGAATSANQATEIASLSSIDTKLTSQATAAKQDTGNASLSSIDGKLTTTNASLASIDAGIPVALGANTAANSMPVALATNQDWATGAKQDTGNTSLSSLDTKASTQITSLQLIDDIPHAQNATLSKGVPFMGQLDDTSTVAATEDAVAVARITAQRAVHVNLRHNSGTEVGISGNQFFTRDLINIAGQGRAQSVTTTAAQALGAASVLTARKFISVTPTNGTVYWGFTSGVTTSSGAPIFKNQTKVFAFSDVVAVYLIAATTVDCRIAEGS